MQFKLKKIGRISSAEIDVKPLTILVGKNDSGKTYAATAIWSFVDFVNKFASDKLVDGYAPLGNFLNSISNALDGISDPHQHHYSLKISSSELNLMRNSIVKDYLDNNGEILEEAIGYDGFSNSKVELMGKAHEHSIDLNISLALMVGYNELTEHTTLIDETDAEDDDELEEEKVFSFHATIECNNGTIETVQHQYVPHYVVNDFLLQDIKNKILSFSCFAEKMSAYRNLIYLPAARTGIMLALDYFVQGAVQRSGLTLREQLNTKHGLPAPIHKFASLMARSNMSARSVTKPALRNLIRGELGRAPRRGAFFYTPEGLEHQIPLASTSSLVTELSSFALLQRRLNRPALLIFEEPEAHLHLDAQREMARELARLVNRGLTVVVTTHSDTFVQQINNLICLSDHPNKSHLISELELEEADLIDRGDVAAYDFGRKGQATVVTALKLTPTGFVVNSLNEVLVKLAEETLLINDGL